MEQQSEILAQIERLSFHLKVSKEKFNLAMDQGHEFEELRKILFEIKELEKALENFIARRT